MYSYLVTIRTRTVQSVKCLVTGRKRWIWFLARAGNFSHQHVQTGSGVHKASH